MFVSPTAHIPVPGVVLCGRVVQEAVENRAQLRRRFILHPDDPIKLGLDMVVCLCVLASVVEVPIAVGFSLPESTALLVFEACTDTMFMLDIVSGQFVGWLRVSVGGEVENMLGCWFLCALFWGRTLQ
jgi:hypothetical protein